MIRPNLRETLLFVALLLAWAWFVHFRADVHTANEAARTYFVQAVVDHGTSAVDPVLEHYGFGNSDVVGFGGRRYMDKAPGLTTSELPKP